MADSLTYEELEQKVYQLETRLHEYEGSDEQLQQQLSNLIDALRQQRDLLKEKLVESAIEMLERNEALEREITERRRVEKDLRESEEKFRALVEVSSDWAYETDKDGTFTYADPKVKAFLGYEPEEVVGRPFNYFMPEGEAKKASAFFSNNVAKAVPFSKFKNIQIHKDGRQIVIETSGMPIFDKDGNFAGWRGLDTDITDKVQIENALKESELRYRDLVENVNDLIWEVDAKGIYTYLSPQSISFLGYSPEELLGRSPFEMMPPDEENRIRTVWKELLSTTGSRRYIEAAKIHKDGSLIHTETSGKPFFDTDGSLLGYRGIERNVTERKQAEEKIRTEHDKFRGVLNVMGEGLYIVNQDYEVEFQNDILERHFPLSKAKKCYSFYRDLNRPCEFCRLNETIAVGLIQQAEANLSNGRIYEVNSSPFTDVDGETKVIVLLRDITEKKTLQAEAVRAGHLAALGELAAGVAHEINNPITGVINYAEILKDQFIENFEDPDIPVRIIKEGERIAKIVRKLLFFARYNDEGFSLCHLRDILGDVLSLMEKRLLKDSITLRLDFPGALPAVKVCNQEIQQVFLNIISNGQYFLNQKFSGIEQEKILQISGEVLEVEGTRHVRMTFWDNGMGIPARIMNKICNPFFSTKPKGEGTGLGLSISHGIIKNHGGRLMFESVEGQYTKVFVDLPVDNY